MGNDETCICIGAGGFWGQYVCEALQGRCDLVRTTTKPEAARRKGWIYLDVARPETLINLPPHADVIIFLVMSPYYKMFPERALDIWQIHVQGLLLVLEYARKAKVRHVVLASSGSVYAPSTELLCEQAPLATGHEGNFYAHSKIAGEMLLHSYASFFSTSILRLFMPYGEGIASNMLMAFLADAVLHHRAVFLQGKDGMEFTPIHIRDAAQAVVRALSLQGQHTINVAGSEVVSIGQVCRIMGELCGSMPVFEHKGAACRIAAHTDTMHRLLGVPQIPFSLGIKDFMAWRLSMQQQ